MPILGPEDSGRSAIVRWPAWAVVLTVLLAAALVYVGFEHMRGRYLLGDSWAWTLLLFAGIMVSIAAVAWLAQRRAQRPS